MASREQEDYRNFVVFSWRSISFDIRSNHRLITNGGGVTRVENQFHEPPVFCSTYP
jgi:hypothetical protein